MEWGEISTAGWICGCLRLCDLQCFQHVFHSLQRVLGFLLTATSELRKKERLFYFVEQALSHFTTLPQQTTGVDAQRPLSILRLVEGVFGCAFSFLIIVSD